MIPLGQFILYNLLPALASGLLAWLVIVGSIRVLQIDYGPLRLSLLYAPLIKATLIMLGIGLALPWPVDFFMALHAQALTPLQLLPYFLAWIGLILLLKASLARLARRMTLQNLTPAEQDAPRLVGALNRVMAAYQASDGCRVGPGWVNCCLKRALPRPRLLVSKQIASPFIVNAEAEPVLVFPSNLIAQLTDEELRTALAHEMAHLTLEQPVWCSSNTIRQLVGIAPLAGLLEGQLRQEEELACDDMAIAVLGQPEIHAGMLLKSYRFARQEAGPLAEHIQSAQLLVGSKPRLSRRIERLTRPNHLPDRLWLQRCATCFLWIGVILFF